MAQLILTDQEKAAALWSDLDDAALGKLVKRRISFIQSAAEQMDRVTSFAAGMLICCAAAEAGSKEMRIDIQGLTQASREFGDWTVLATREEAGQSMALQKDQGGSGKLTFEAWAGSKGFDLSKGEDGRYANLETIAAMRGFLAFAELI